MDLHPRPLRLSKLCGALVHFRPLVRHFFQLELKRTSKVLELGAVAARSTAGSRRA